ncbi:g11112 [Coccomyxa elongata]
MPVITVRRAGAAAGGALFAVVTFAHECDGTDVVKDTVTGAAGRVVEAGQAMAGLLQSLATSIASGKPSLLPRGKLTMSLAQQAEAWAESQEHAEVLVMLGGRMLLDWLLVTAAKPDSSPEQLNAERALLNLLQHRRTASAVLYLPGAVPKMLDIAGKSPDSDEFADALLNALGGITLPAAASMDEIRSMLVQAKGESGPKIQELAVACLSDYAESSVVNCGKIAVVGGGAELGQIAAAAVQEGRRHTLETQLTRIMGILARDCPIRHLLGMGQWLDPLLFFVADAAAQHDWALAARAMDSFSACIKYGSQLDADVATANVYPLLDRLAGEPDLLLRRSLLTAIAALALPGAATGELPEPVRERWSERILEWLCSDECEESLRFACAGALAALASENGPGGLDVACAWLGDLLIYLTRGVVTYQSIREVTAPQEVTEAVYANAVSVLPAYARGCAAELRGISERAASWAEPPPHMDDVAPPVSPVPPSAQLEARLADPLLCRCLKVMCALVANEPAKQQWLRSAGILHVLYRLTLGMQQRGSDSTEEEEEEGLSTALGQHLSRSLQRQVARLLAILSADEHALGSFQGSEWQRWLDVSASTEDCKLSSHARRATLNLESAQALASAEMDEVGMRQPLSGAAGGGNAALQGPRLVMRDTVHLFDPGARHHHVLATEGTATTSPEAPSIDVVFVHGIRGGPFVTWRRERTPGVPAASVVHDQCWPSTWLVDDVPTARLLSMEYAAPASGWEGQSLPLWGTVGQLMDQLTAAGVGQRPVVFVCHSMGGILIKEMLAKSASEGAPLHHRALLDATAGLVFYATPHHGSWLADVGWNLRFLGASPASSVVHLKPGAHLEEVNSVIRGLHEAGRLEVLSYCEGMPMSLVPVLPRLVVVPPESAFPGFGRTVLLPDADHIDACKPPSRQDPAYAELLDLVMRVNSKRASPAAETDAADDGDSISEQTCA